MTALCIPCSDRLNKFIHPAAIPGLPQEKLTETLEQLLRRKKFCFGGPDTSDIIPYEEVDILYERNEDPAFRNRLDTSLRELLASFDIAGKEGQREDVWFAANLIYVIAKNRVPGAAGDLRNNALSWRCVGVPKDPPGLPFNAPDLQFLLLEALLEYNRGEQSVMTYKMFFDERNGLYANVCYRGLWKNDSGYGIEYLPRLARFYVEKANTPGSFAAEFGFFLEEHHAAFAENGIKKINKLCGFEKEKALIIDEFIRFRQALTKHERAKDTRRNPLQTPSP